MSYIVKNCPCGYALANTIACTCNEGYQKWCEYTDDCIIKQVIELCKQRTVGFIEEGAIKEEILQLFDIEEIRE